jgi:hypothetical protein
MINHIRARNAIYKWNQTGKPARRLPPFPNFITTPDPSLSNVGTGTKLTTNEALSQLDPTFGTTNECVDAYVEYVCDCANRGHSALSQVDHHSAGKDHMPFILNLVFCRHPEGIKLPG